MTVSLRDGCISPEMKGRGAQGGHICAAARFQHFQLHWQSLHLAKASVSSTDSGRQHCHLGGCPQNSCPYTGGSQSLEWPHSVTAKSWEEMGLPTKEFGTEGQVQVASHRHLVLQATVQQLQSATAFPQEAQSRTSGELEKFQVSRILFPSQVAQTGWIGSGRHSFSKKEREERKEGLREREKEWAEGRKEKREKKGRKEEGRKERDL